MSAVPIFGAAFHTIRGKLLDHSEWYWLSPFPDLPLTAQADVLVQLVGIELGSLPPT
jgi:hypothetical protein